MYRIPQAGRFEHYALVQHLSPYVYHPTKNTPGLWTHEIRPVTVSLLAKTICVNYSVKEHTLHLKSDLESKYKVTIYWDVKLYVGISLTWDYG